MRIAFVNANYQKNHTGGGHVHMEQFVANAIALGHEIWVYPHNQYPSANTIPTDRVNHIKTMRQMDVLYVRLENNPPNISSWSLPPRRFLYGFPIVVWEFNTIPDEGLMRGEPIKKIKEKIEYLKRFGKGCDLAICMSKPLADYVRNQLEINHTLIVPNGSDPKLFTPDAHPVKRLDPFKEFFNVVWIGSAKIIYHDFEMIKNAAQRIIEWDDGKQIKIHIIGPDLIGKMADMPANVFYWGAENYQQLPNWLRSMDVGLYVTRGDLTHISTPLKFFDYLASGLAVVSTSQPVFINEIFHQLEQTDLLIPPGDAIYLANVLIKLSQDRKRVKKLGMAGRQLVIDKYNWQRAVEDTMAAIEGIFKEKGIVPKHCAHEK